jgi:hypothetical protein
VLQLLEFEPILLLILHFSPWVSIEEHLSKMDGVVETRSNSDNGTQVCDQTTDNPPQATDSAPGGQPSPENTEDTYPPTRDAFLILCGVATALFLVSLLSLSSSPPKVSQPNSIIHRTE